ncbi:MAG: hypothetical protein JOZ58_26240 [Acetobacteraceae bacterium]|nr:hypothetical protein [Acetobacteraceae bacterium]
MASAFNHHVAAACKGAGIAPADLPTIIDEHAFNAVWGSAFEDLLARDLPDKPNVVDDYLKRRGWKDSVPTREYMAGLRRSVLSLYEVSEVVPGESMALRDLVRGGDPVRVTERSGSRSLHQWDRIATRVIPVRSGAVISGTLLIFDHESSEEILASLGRVRLKAARETTKLVADLGRPEMTKRVSAVLTPELQLSGSAFLFTNRWLARLLEHEKDARFPQVANSDGEPFMFISLHFPLLPSTTPEILRNALGTISSLRRAGESFWNWLQTGPSDGEAARSPAGKARLITTMDDGAHVLGTVEITPKAVTLSVNSERRAERGRALVEPALSGLVRAPFVERQELKQALAEKRSEPTPPSGLSPAEERAIVQQSLDAHYRQTLDQPIPLLGDISPRHAVRTPRGRERVAAWLKMLENNGVRRPPDDPMAGYDFRWMWAELGIQRLRR